MSSSERVITFILLMAILAVFYSVAYLTYKPQTNIEKRTALYDECVATEGNSPTLCIYSVKEEHPELWLDD